MYQDFFCPPPKKKTGVSRCIQTMIYYYDPCISVCIMRIQDLWKGGGAAATASAAGAEVFGGSRLKILFGISTPAPPPPPNPLVIRVPNKRFPGIWDQNIVSRTKILNEKKRRKSAEIRGGALRAPSCRSAYRYWWLPSVSLVVSCSGRQYPSLFKMI